MTKQDEAEQAKLAKQYADGELPEGWGFDPISEMRGGPRFVRTDAGEPAAEQAADADADVEG